MKHEPQTVFDVQPDRHPVPFQPFHPKPRRVAGWHQHLRLARFRRHAGKTIAADERCWPEMLRVHYRDGGSWLDGFYIPPRYPNGFPEGAPYEHYGPLHSEEAILYAGEILELVRTHLA